jgi:CxxC motif-containing protein (DUF1111 family)
MALVSDARSDEAILAGARDRGDGVHGRPNWVQDEITGRASVVWLEIGHATLRQFVADAFRNELWITNPPPRPICATRRPDRRRCAASGVDDTAR